MSRLLHSSSPTSEVPSREEELPGPANGIFFPDIDFAIVVIAGADNTLDQIVILPFLDEENAQLVGGDEDVVLAMEGVPGFGIKVLAHSTFVRDPDTGELVQQPLVMSSSQVKFDKIPMPAPQGSTPLVVGTLQPPGVVLNPSAAGPAGSPGRPRPIRSTATLGRKLL